METAVIQVNNSSVSKKTLFFSKQKFDFQEDQIAQVALSVGNTQFEKDSQSNIETLINAFVLDGWDEEDSKGTNARCKRSALKFASFLDNQNIPVGFAYPLRDGGIGFSWSPGRTKKLNLEAEIEFSEDDVILYFVYSSIDGDEIFNDYLTDYDDFTKKIIELFRENKEI